MRAVVYEKFGELPKIQTVPDPTPTPDGVVVKVEATGVCRSDWHGWKGHDHDINLPHVPGHELAGVVVAIGTNVQRWKEGDRVTIPFVGGCGHCSQCAEGQHQVCDNQFQPGFTHWGSFAEYVALDYADINLVAIPKSMSFTTAASLGCRFVTSFRAVVDQARVSAGEWVAVHGCGGVGLSAVMIANALGANVIAIDLSDETLLLAKSLGAIATINASRQKDVVGMVRELTGGGVHVSIDALGHQSTCFNSISNLRKRGRHIQVGLMLAEHSLPKIPMGLVIANELEILGSHGMQAHQYARMFRMISAGKLAPEKLVGKTITLSDSIQVLTSLDKFDAKGISVITDFRC
jgi:alcohol dehydrogenase